MRTSATRTARKAADNAPRLRLTVQHGSGAVGLPVRSTVRRWLSRTLPRDAIVTVRFVGIAEGRRLNRDFRGRDYATNVLTFSYETDGVHRTGARTGRAPPLLVGDIVLCVGVLRREAREQQKTLRAHCAHLLIHGALHLAGYDHQSDKDAKVMEALEIELLGSLGYQNPYAH